MKKHPFCKRMFRMFQEKLISHDIEGFIEFCDQESLTVVTGRPQIME